MRKNTLLSFVIPVYNAAPFIRECVGSIVRLPGEWYEIVLVNDGSRDASGAICDRLAAESPRISVLHQPNLGASSARNAGMRQAEGRYLWFVDADDRVDPLIFKSLENWLSQKESFDILLFPYRTVQGMNAPLPDSLRNRVEREGEMSGADYLYRGNYELYVWNKIYRNDFLRKNNLFFPDGVSTIEDWLFNFRAFAAARRVVEKNTPGYLYNCGNPSSTMRNRDKDHLAKQAADSMLVHRLAREFLDGQRDKSYYAALRELLNVSVTGFFFSLYRFDLPTTLICHALEEYRSLRLYPVPFTRNARANLFLRLLNRRALFLTLCRLHALLPAKKSSTSQIPAHHEQ